MGFSATNQTAMVTISRDTVLAVALTSDLTSASSHVGDKFTAKLLTHGTDPYSGLPFGAVVYGSVKYVKPLEGNSPGLLELGFDGIKTPSGNKIPISGQLVDLKGKFIFKTAEGIYIDHDTHRYERVVFTGYGRTSRSIVGVLSNHPVENAALPSSVAAMVGPVMRKGFTDEVQLPSDSQLGVLLLEPLKIPQGIM
jgi:hypothetical protein